MRALLASGLAATLLLAPSTGLLQTARAETFVTVQPAGQWLASQFIGQSVTNQAGERIRDINDLLFGKDGKIANVVIGVGGFLGIGAKNVGVPYESLSIASDANGKRVITVALSKERLQAAPDFKPTETTVYMRAREQAGKLGREAIDKTKELTGEASKKIEDMRK